MIIPPCCHSVSATVKFALVRCSVNPRSGGRTLSRISDRGHRGRTLRGRLLIASRSSSDGSLIGSSFPGARLVLRVSVRDFPFALVMLFRQGWACQREEAAEIGLVDAGHDAP